VHDIIYFVLYDTPQTQGWTQLWPHPLHLILGMPLTLRLLPYTFIRMFFAAMEQVESSKIYAGVNNLKDQLVLVIGTKQSL
jgi:hypothetical protein